MDAKAEAKREKCFVNVYEHSQKRNYSGCPWHVSRGSARQARGGATQAVLGRALYLIAATPKDVRS